jgi:endonuclease/exonuclease/phosphatase family metal-dependent hydrolase
MRPIRLFALSFAVGVGALAGCGEGTGAAQSSAAISATAVHPENPGRKKFLTAMTRNLYIGADLFAPFQSEDPLGAAEQVWAEILASNFAARAGAIADEIVGASPDVVGLQEVYRFIVTPLGAAEPVLQDLDYLALLMGELEAIAPGRYRVAASQDETNLPIPFPDLIPGLPVQIRIIDRDVILADADVEVGATDGGNFTARFETQLADIDVVQLRGWVKATVRKERVETTFVNTHLEVKEFGPLQALQAIELAGLFGSVRPIVVVGDTNSDPEDPPIPFTPAPGAPQVLLPTPYTTLSSLFTDAWTNVGDGSGLTCCFDADIAPPSRDLFERVDLVLVGADATSKAAWRVGLEPLEDLGNRWPSDHAGVAAILRFNDTETVSLEIE